MIIGSTLNMANFSQSKFRLFFVTLVFFSVLWLGWLRYPGSQDLQWTQDDASTEEPASSKPTETEPFRISPSSPLSVYPKSSNPAASLDLRPGGQVELLKSIAKTSQYFIDYPLAKSQFGEMGERVQIVRSWMKAREDKSYQLSKDQLDSLTELIEKTTLSLFPFLQNPSQPARSHAFNYLQQSFLPKSKGIVIPTGTGTFRYACHLITNLRQILHSKLPIQIMYAGDEDLPSQHREFMKGLGADIETVDIKTVFDDTTLGLASGGWAIKSFAALASKFEQVVLLDADAVFLQDPEVVLDNHAGYKDTGALFFHDRLLWQGAFKERHEWWEKQLEHHTPSATLSKSLVYNEKYAEECDSGMVVLNKGRLSTLFGALHVCWQNTRDVREAHTYIMGHGDKESWWFGFELSDASYTFENHYGSVLGAVKTDGTDGKTRVCGFTIAHVDENDRLLWYNGSLLKNKAVNVTEFDIPVHWMMEGVWEKGAVKADLSCMRDAEVLHVTTQEKDIVQKSVDAAKAADVKMIEIFKDII